MPVGAGKTAVVLHALDELLSLGELTKVLIIAPLQVANHVWAQELAMWPRLKLDLAVATGPGGKRVLALKHQVVVCTYDLLPWLARRPEFRDFDGIVWDEISKMKGAGTKRMNAVREKLKRIHWAVGLTGTAISTDIADLYGQLRVLDGGKTLGRSQETFRQRYMRVENPYAPFKKWVPQEGAQERLMQRLEPLTFRIPEEVYRAQLPPCVVTPVEAQLDSLLLKDYRALQEDGLLELDDDLTVEAHAVTKAQQLACGFIYDSDGKAHWLGEGKLAALESVLTDEPTLVFYWFEAEAKRIEQDFQAVRLDVNRWNRGEQRLALAHPLSMGHGLNLQHGGRRIIWTAPPWSAELWEQANGRLLRSGQERTVYVHVLTARGTLDPQVLGILNERVELGRAIVRG